MDGKTYDGQFTTKKLSIRDMGYIGTRKAQLNGGFHYDENNPGVGIDGETNATNNMIAHLEVCLIQHPPWWDLDKVYDVGLLAEVFSHVAEFENSFFRSMRSNAEADAAGSSPDGRNGENEKSGTAGRVEEVGGGQVPPSLDP
jgi:hypothetical protein